MLIEVGAAAPPFTLEGQAGTVALDDLRGDGPALLAFFKTTCGTCRLAFPVYGDLHRRYGDALPVLAVGQDPLDACRTFLDSHDYDGPVVEDPAPDYPASSAYGIEAVPTLVLVGADGQVQRVTQGWDREEINAWARLLGEHTGGPTDPLSTPEDGRPPFKPG